VDFLFRLPTKNGPSVKRLGTKSIGEIPRTIARWLGLENYELYTGHAIRRTTATTIADRGGDTSTLKRYLAWKSDRVAESYVTNTENTRNNMANALAPRDTTITSKYFPKRKAANIARDSTNRKLRATKAVSSSPAKVNPKPIDTPRKSKRPIEITNDEDYDTPKKIKHATEDNVIDLINEDDAENENYTTEKNLPMTSGNSLLF